MMDNNIGMLIKDRWKVIRKLGEGGFGAVYEIHSDKDDETLALKAEIIREKNQVLKMEIAVLIKLQGKSHVCEYIDCGRNDRFNYLIMAMLGKSLGQLRSEARDGQLSVGTTTSVAIQCTEALEDLHNAGFLHRDIKPSNFAIGRHGSSLRTVHMLDFGLARKYLNDQGGLRTPRSTAGFRGTVRYASLNTHNRKVCNESDGFRAYWLFNKREET